MNFFALRAGWLILREGMPSLKQSVVGGQYEYPKGLFFGGKRLEQGPEKYRSFLTGSLKRTFYPQDGRWQQSVLVRGKKLLNQSLAELLA